MQTKYIFKTSKFKKMQSHCTSSNAQFNFCFLVLLPQLGSVTHSPLSAPPPGMDSHWGCACRLGIMQIRYTSCLRLFFVLYCCGWAGRFLEGVLHIYAFIHTNSHTCTHNHTHGIRPFTYIQCIYIYTYKHTLLLVYLQTVIVMLNSEIVAVQHRMACPEALLRIKLLSSTKVASNNRNSCGAIIKKLFNLPLW